MTNDCEKCGHDFTAKCCDFDEERKELLHQIKMEQVLKCTYSDIVKRLEEKITRLEILINKNKE